MRLNLDSAVQVWNPRIEKVQEDPCVTKKYALLNEAG